MARENSTPIERLFGSKTRAKLLNLFFGNTDKSYYVREITRVIEEQIHSVRRELLNLSEIGIIKSETFDNKIYYSANMKHPLSHPLNEMFARKILSVQVQEVVQNSWEDYVRPVARYLKALVVINRLPGQDGVDLLIIGNDSTKKLTHWAENVEKKQGKPLNYVIMSKDDYLYRKSVKDKFISDVMELEVAEIIDPEKIIKE